MKKCDFCGTTDGSHSAECVDTDGKGYKSPQAASEAGSAGLALLDAKDLAIAALDNLANEFLKLGFTDYARSGKEYQKVIKGQIIIAKQILARRGI